MSRHLLLCLDAFGTLFVPKGPVAEQYASVARQCGLPDIRTAQVETAFRSAFARHATAQPNYGKATGMDAERWWTSVITDTFTQIIAPRPIPRDLAPRLLHRFSSGEGYHLLEPAVPSLLAELKSSRPTGMTTVGVVTNSDDRVPGILASLGVRCSGVRYPLSPQGYAPGEGHGQGEYEVDFHCMSYDVGLAKPDVRIFEAAEEMARQLSSAFKAGRGGDGDWLRVYVGDEPGKDVKGALDAGWNAVLLKSPSPTPVGGVLTNGEDEEYGIEKLDAMKRVDEIFVPWGRPRAVSVGGLDVLLRWLVRG